MAVFLGGEVLPELFFKLAVFNRHMFHTLLD